jgi:hypothetical protein
MKTNKWYPVTSGGQQIAVKFSVVTSKINQVKVSISIPCRKGQYVVLQGVNQEDFAFYYGKEKCIIEWYQNTTNVTSLEYLLIDIQIWFRFSHAIRMDEGLFTSMELLRVF